MSNRSRYHEHKPLTSPLGRFVGRAPGDPDLVARYAHDAYHDNRGIYFTEDQLAKMPWQSRELIESEARRIYGERRRT